MSMTRMAVWCAAAVLLNGCVWAGEASGGGAPERDVGNAPRILIAYYSRTGNTRAVAESIQALVGGDLFQVRTLQPYPEAYDDVTRQARRELDEGARPELAATVADMGAYDVIYLGYPIWWGTMPMAMFTFLEQANLSGKTIIPFCTHGGSGLARSVDDIRTLCPGAAIQPALALSGGSAARAGREVETWLRRIGQIR